MKDDLVNTSVVAVIDGCRKRTKECDRDELTFLCDNSALAEYKGVGNCCDVCSKEGKVPSPIGISGHGFFCAAIVASPELHKARLEKLGSNTLKNASPSRVAIYACGCPSCYKMVEHDVAEGIKASILARVNVISISVMRSLPAWFVDENEPDFHQRDYNTLDALRAEILVIVSSGNDGAYGLHTVQKSAPWYLTVGSCTSYKRFKTTIEFATNAAIYDLQSLEGYSTSKVQTQDHIVVRKKGDIHNRTCLMYVERVGEESVIVIEASQGAITADPKSLVFISKQTSNSILLYLNRVAADNGILLASFDSSPRTDLNRPSVSYFSGRGPCSYYKDFMKPDLCAPGKEIVAPWPHDVPLEDHEKSCIATYSVLSGTSFSTPHVAAGVVTIMTENKFSVSATISAAITTADRMHGEDLTGYEFAYGAGVFNLEKAMRPGLVYEEVVDAFDEYVYGGTKSHCDLNLPYFSATFPLGSGKWVYRFPRKVKSVEKGRCTYIAEVVVHATTLNMPLGSIKISVDPSRLVFEDLDDEQKFTLKVDLPHTKSEEKFAIISSSLIWTKEAVNENDVKIVVESPIILSSKDMSVLLIDSQAP